VDGRGRGQWGGTRSRPLGVISLNCISKHHFLTLCKKDLQDDSTEIGKVQCCKWLKTSFFGRVPLLHAQYLESISKE
jgi:hypothetical protein